VVSAFFHRFSLLCPPSFSLTRDFSGKGIRWNFLFFFPFFLFISDRTGYFLSPLTSLTFLPFPINSKNYRFFFFFSPFFVRKGKKNSPLGPCYTFSSLLPSELDWSRDGFPFGPEIRGSCPSPRTSPPRPPLFFLLPREEERECRFPCLLWRRKPTFPFPDPSGPPFLLLTMMDIGVLFPFPP